MVERVVLIATYVVLAAIGVLAAVIAAFLIPERIDGTAGLSAVLAFVGCLLAGSLGGVGLRSFAGAVVPFASWFLAMVTIAFVAPGGDVIIPGKLGADPGIVNVGPAMMVLGIFGGALGLVVTTRYTARVKAPRPDL